MKRRMFVAFLIISIPSILHASLTLNIQDLIHRRKEKKKKRIEIRNNIATIQNKIRITNQEFKRAQAIQNDTNDLALLHNKKNITLARCNNCNIVPETMEIAAQELQTIETAITNKKKSIQKFKLAKRKERAALKTKHKELIRELRNVR